MVSTSINQLINEIRENPGRNPYITAEESEEDTQWNAVALAWAKGHEQALNKLEARYNALTDVPEEPNHPTQYAD